MDKKTVRKSLVAGTLVGAAVVTSKPVQAQIYSCSYEFGYCNGAGGYICSLNSTGGGISYFTCCDTHGFLYDGYCS